MKVEDFLEECMTIKKYVDEKFVDWFSSKTYDVRDKTSLYQFLVKEFGRRNQNETVSNVLETF